MAWLRTEKLSPQESRLLAATWALIEGPGLESPPRTLDQIVAELTASLEPDDPDNPPSAVVVAVDDLRRLLDEVRRLPPEA